MLRLFLISCFILSASISYSQNITISGTVKSSENGEVLIGATVQDNISRRGTVTNQFGYYSFSKDTSITSLSFSYVGFQPEKVEFNILKDTVLHIQLEPLNELDEVIVESSRSEPIHESAQMGNINVPIRQIKSMPALMGEVDVLKVLQLLPGVQSGVEGASGLYVRGGSPDQNLILLDGVPVYNVSHLFGFFSLFNADALNNVELVKGGFPARYGGRLSSVIDINMKEGNMKEFHGEGGIGLVASRLTLEGPIIKDRTSFLISGRRTYIDYLAKPLISNYSDGDNLGYYFYDVNAKLNHIVNDKNRIFFSLYAGDDVGYSKSDRSHVINGETFTDKSEFGLSWGNLISALRWNHVFSNKLFGNFTASYTKYNFRLFNENDHSRVGGEEDFEDYYLADYRSGIRDYALKADFDYIPNSNNYIRFGLSNIFHQFSPGVFAGISKTDTLQNLGANQMDSQEYAAYIENDIAVTNTLKFNVGLHYSGFLVDNQHYNYLQPRLSGRYMLDEKSSIKFSFVTMAQYVHLLTNAGLGLPTDLWVPVTSNIGPQRSWQGSLGYFKSLTHGLEWSVEGYYKDMNGLIEYQDGASFLHINKNWEDLVEVGRGRSYGLEMFVQKKLGKTTGWLGYTLSKTERKFENINFNRWFPFRYDRTHDVSLTVSHKLSSKIHLSGTWVYGTGNAISFPSTIYQSTNNPEVGIAPGHVEHYESRNNFRVRDYHRLDLGVSFVKDTRWGVRTWNVSVYNAYNRMNPFFVDIGFNQQAGTKMMEQYSLFPILPSVMYGFKF
ncbi:TonB-dependent receptor [Litoribacter populi]|uniref:TonB-dependent receptor n=1 Tax=Litoribacter populi TaxID=2598460 RepID=UPI00117CEE95|nr:TonB-dependent receptor [Litoribacter populi]